MRDPRREAPWLPDLCRLPRLAALLGMAELVVVVLVLAPDDARTWTLGRFLSAWQHVGGRHRGIDGVLTVIDQLAGCAVPASAL